MASATFNYKKTITTNMKMVGILDTDEGIIQIDGVDKEVMKTLADFNGATVTITVKVTEDEELEDPSVVE